jgi:GcrA cell cycle regulator
MAGESSWTIELEVALAKLWAEGLPAAEIARRLGVSKNAAVGKAHRLGLKGRPSPLKPPPQRRGTGLVFKPKCRFITGDAIKMIAAGQDPFDCPKLVVDGKPYCAEHAARCYTKPAAPGRILLRLEADRIYR